MQIHLDTEARLEVVQSNDPRHSALVAGQMAALLDLLTFAAFKDTTNEEFENEE